MNNERDCNCTDPECDFCNPDQYKVAAPSWPPPLPPFSDSLTEEERRLLNELTDAISRVQKDFAPEPKPEYKPSYYILDDIDVHTEHCCSKHKVCKYNDLDCTVATGLKKASCPCNCDHF